jgi:hypothetical protein
VGRVVKAKPRPLYPRKDPVAVVKMMMMMMIIIIIIIIIITPRSRVFSTN